MENADQKPKISKEMLTLSILTVITVFTWISFDVYRTLKKPAPVEIPAEILKDLDPTLKTEIIDKLAEREDYNKEDLNTAPIATPTEIVEVSESTTSADQGTE